MLRKKTDHYGEDLDWVAKGRTGEGLNTVVWRDPTGANLKAKKDRSISSKEQAEQGSWRVGSWSVEGQGQVSLEPGRMEGGVG